MARVPYWSGAYRAAPSEPRRASVARRGAEWPDELQHLDDFSDLQLALTPDEVRQFERELGALLARYRRHDPATRLPEGGAVVSFQYQLYPESRQTVPSPRDA